MKRNKRLTGILAAVLSIHLLCTNTGVVLAEETTPTSKSPVDIIEVGTIITETTEESNDTIIANDETGIPDKNLYDAILTEADTDKNGILTVSEAEALYTLLAAYQIEDLKGIEYCTHLKHLDLSDNNISDITPLANLTQLSFLDLHRNNISDITPLKNLTQLNSLYLYSNNISDITSLENLTQLSFLDLSNNNISDITPLKNFTQLSLLNLSNNYIRNTNALDYLITTDCDIDTKGNPIGESIIYTPSDFAETLKEKDIVIPVNKFVTITFKQGSTINTSAGNTEYDFHTTVINDFSSANISTNLKEIFIQKISYEYSGTLPAAAEIRIFLGTKYANNEVHYTLLNTDGTVNTEESQPAVVDADGYITIIQDHCSDYIITSEKPENPKQETNDDKKPADSDNDSFNDDSSNNESDSFNNDTTNNGTANNGQNNSTNDNADAVSPKTSETASLSIWIALSSFGIFAVVLLYLKKQNSR